MGSTSAVDRVSWTKGEADMRSCRTCGLLSNYKPSPTCDESRHIQRYARRLSARRRARRMKRYDAHETTPEVELGGT